MPNGSLLVMGVSIMSPLASNWGSITIPYTSLSIAPCAVLPISVFSIESNYI